MSRREEILEQVHSVRALPTAAMDVLRLAKNPESAIGDLTQAVERDPGLASNLLRLANSARFGARREIGTVKDAILRLGTKTVSQLVVTAAISPIAGRSLKGYDLPAGDLLRESVASALAVEKIALAVGIKVPIYGYTTGLLHDIGKILLGTFIEVDPRPILDLAFKEHLSFEESEAKILGIDHAEAGSVLLDLWGCPTDIVAAVKWHHKPDEFPHGDSTLTDLVHVADELIRSSGIGAGIDGLNYRPSRKSSKRLKMNTRIAESVVCLVLSELNEFISALDVKG